MEETSLLENGSWTGALGYLADGLFDVACLFYQRNDERDRDFHFTSSFQRVSTILILTFEDFSKVSVGNDGLLQTQFVMFSRLKTEPMPPTLGSPYEVFTKYVSTKINTQLRIAISGVDCSSCNNYCTKYCSFHH